MNKLYRYRPLSEFLFKELFYQELYFASYKELNDPLDLSARIEFTAEKETDIEYLIWLLFKTTLKISDNGLTDLVKENNKKLLAFNKNDELRNAFRKCIYTQINQIKTENNFIWLEQLEKCLANTVKEQNINFKIDFQSFKSELQRLSQKFLENSYTVCFSAKNDDFLMWSHYASKHSGICLEFNLAHPGLFPYKQNGTRKLDQENYLQRISHWNTETQIYWDRIREVNYKEEQPFINFFNFSPVFENEHDCDLIGLSKSWTHGFAHELEWVFSTKTIPWSYEKEWRAIEINFRESEEPENRIRHYPIECLSGIYFGIRTPETAKKRISKIFKHKKSIQFFEAKLSNGRELHFDTWEYYDE